MAALCSRLDKRVFADCFESSDGGVEVQSGCEQVDGHLQLKDGVAEIRVAEPGPESRGAVWSTRILTITEFKVRKVWVTYFHF